MFFYGHVYVSTPCSGTEQSPSWPTGSHRRRDARCAIVAPKLEYGEFRSHRGRLTWSTHRYARPLFSFLRNSRARRVGGPHTVGQSDWSPIRRIRRRRGERSRDEPEASGAGPRAREKGTNSQDISHRRTQIRRQCDCRGFPFGWSKIR